MSVALTESMDVAQVVLYVFWLFFFGLIFWLRREDRREGYPLEGDKSGNLGTNTPIMIPPPKTFLLPHGGTYEAPNYARDTRELQGRRTADSNGSPWQPEGDPLLAGMGPAAYAERADEVETTREGHDAIAPLRAATDFKVDGGADPRGFKVVGADGAVAGVVKDIWVDRADVLVRYLEMELSGGGRRLIPMPMLLIHGEKKLVEVYALLGKQFPLVPTTKEADRVTLLEEERISAFYAGGRLYAEPKRARPLV